MKFRSYSWEVRELLTLNVENDACKIMIFTLWHVIQNGTRSVGCRNHISFQLLMCLPLFYAYVVISLWKTCSLSLQWTSTSCSLRRGKSSQSNDAHGQRRSASFQQTIFILMDCTRCFIRWWLRLTGWHVFGGFLLGFVRRPWLFPLQQFKMMQMMVELQESLVYLFDKQTAVLV